MDEKPVAGLVTAAVAVPLVALCCLGPAVLGSILGGMVGWFGGLNAVEVAAAALAAGALAYGFLRWRRARRARIPSEPSRSHDAAGRVPTSQSRVRRREFTP